jgi:hypothetical protein
MKHENCTVELSTNRLILSKDCVSLLNISPGERLSIAYYQIDNQTTIPLIGKSELFTDAEDGNRLTKSNTVSYRGMQNEVLKLYGNFFCLEDFKTNIYKLISVTTDNNNL